MKDYTKFYAKYDNPNFPFITERTQAKENIKVFNQEIDDSPEMINRLASVRKWYYNEELRMFAPSKFIGYVNNNCKLYVANSTKDLGSNRMDGRKTEVVLEQFSDKVDRFDLRSELESYLIIFNKEPNKSNGLRIFTI
jgi:hypothetical protein